MTRRRLAPRGRHGRHWLQSAARSMKPFEFIRAFARGFITNTATWNEIKGMPLRMVQEQMVKEIVDQQTDVDPGMLRAFGVKPNPGRCCVCGCTEEDACDGGCSWTDDRKILCTSCVP